MKRITKAIIPAAGLGTRFLPITKSFAKEMLPIIDKPNLQFIAEEAMNSGIKELILIVNKDKPEINDYFSRNIELENRLKQANKNNEAKLIKDVSEIINVKFVYQEKPLGLGNAILCAKEAIGDDDFALILGDDLVVNDNNPAIGQLIEQYNKTGNSVIGVQKVAKDQLNKYGIVKYDNAVNDNLFKISSIVEKPNIEDAPSNLACLGRYVFTNEIFNELEKVKPGKNGEYQLTDAIDTLLSYQEVDAFIFEGTRYDIGDKFGYIKAIIDFSLMREDLHDKVIEYLTTIKK